MYEIRAQFSSDIVRVFCFFDGEQLVVLLSGFQKKTQRTPKGEIDRALELLLNKLDEAGKLDNTVIVLLADHYPYNLQLKYINMLSSYERDSLIEANSNNLIIYNSKMKGVNIDKVGMSIDVIPTVYNLFNIDYDSRLIMGKDILSTSEGIAIFKDKSWITSKGTYYASSGRFEAKVDNVDDNYVDTINSIVSNRLAISRMFVENDYYNYLFNKLCLFRQIKLI